MPEETPKVDITEVKFVFTLKMIVITVVTIFSLLGSGYAAYYGISSRIQSVDAALAAQTHTIEAQTTEIKTLKDSNDTLKQQLLELTVTLRTKEIIK